MDIYPKLENKIKCIINSEYKHFLNKDNVVGIGFGYKIKNGFYTNDKCIKVFVSNKISLDRLSSNSVVPVLYKGVPTDVVETGHLTFFSLTGKVRPVQGGYSMSIRVKNTYGSVGCLVTNGVSKFVLGTNHVMANFNNAPIGTPIFQPAYTDGGSRADTFATLYKYVPLRFIEGEHQPINFSDAAIGLLTEPNILSPEIALIGKLNAIKSPKVGEEVKKVGRTTGLTYGTIDSTDVVTTIEVLPNKRCLFKDLIFTTAMSSRGDSGSILVTKHSNNALALHFGGNGIVTVYCRLSTVLDQLGVHLVT